MFDATFAAESLQMQMHMLTCANVWAFHSRHSSELLLHREPGGSGKADAGGVTGSPSRGWQTDIISSPEMHPAAAATITAGLTHTSNNQMGLAASMFYPQTFNTPMRVHTRIDPCNCIQSENSVSWLQGVNHIIGIIPLWHTEHRNRLISHLKCVHLYTTAWSILLFH